VLGLVGPASVLVEEAAGLLLAVPVAVALHPDAIEDVQQQHGVAALTNMAPAASPDPDVAATTTPAISRTRGTP
jgi:hypothetical protein